MPSAEHCGIVGGQNSGVGGGFIRGNSEHSKRADCVCYGLRGLGFFNMGWMSQGIRPSSLAASRL
jgi:hypothetical protein